MSKIVISFATLAQGGAARVCANLSTPFCDAYDSVILVTWTDKPQFYEYDHRAKWYCIEKEVGSRNDMKRMLWFRHLIKHEKPDIILSFLEPLNLRVLICTVGLGVKTIVAERTDPWIVNKYWIAQQLEKLIYRRADAILVQTPTIKRFFNGSLSSRTRIIYNPVNLSEDMVGAALETPKKKRIVSIARLISDKNHDILIKAFYNFLQYHPDYSLTIYGDGPLLDELQSLTKSLNIEDKVSLPGPSKTIHRDILDAEMMCLVSNREGMSNSMIEAMTLGLPCICTKVSGAVDLIEDGINGLLVDIRDEDGLAKNMEFIANNPERAKQIGQSATAVYKLLNKDKIYKEWVDFVKSV
jgi:glycosyltransferase involved in cell wall biosynthesis